jgi:acyl-homoserine lactone acylase PvdQ
MIIAMNKVRSLLPGALTLLLAMACSAALPDYGKVEFMRDTWGVPHVFSDTDRGAMYGLGYATAQERGFQMTYGLRIMQGRLAEVIGERQKAGRKETALDSDRKMRTFGWARAAARIPKACWRPIVRASTPVSMRSKRPEPCIRCSKSLR